MRGEDAVRGERIFPHVASPLNRFPLSACADQALPGGYGPWYHCFTLASKPDGLSPSYGEDAS